MSIDICIDKFFESKHDIPSRTIITDPYRYDVIHDNKPIPLIEYVRMLVREEMMKKEAQDVSILEHAIYACYDCMEHLPLLWLQRIGAEGDDTNPDVLYCLDCLEKYKNVK